MSKHTQGPWVAQLVPTSAGSAYTFKPMRACLYVDGMAAHNAKDSAWDEAHANARLIAAAPDLLEVAQAIADSVLGSGQIKRLPDSDGYYSEPIHQDEMAKLLAAIAKATGND